MARVKTAAAGRVALFVEESDGLIDLLWWGRMASGGQWECPLPPTKGAVVAVYIAPGSSRATAPRALIQAASAWRSRSAT